MKRRLGIVVKIVKVIDNNAMDFNDKMCLFALNDFVCVYLIFM